MTLLRLTTLCLAVPLIALACTADRPALTETPPAASTPAGITLTAAERQTLDVANAFSFTLFRQLSEAQQGENVFVSPLSVSMSLGMAMNGAAGTTLDAMRTTLGFGTRTLADIDASYRGLIAALQHADSTTTFDLANSIWYRQGFPVKQAFLDTTTKWFGAAAQGLNFDDMSGSLAAINGWVSTNTAGMIPNILTSISPDEVMFLLNAVSFDGTWQVKFDPALTSPQPFYSSDGRTLLQTVPTMQRGMYQSPELREFYSASGALVEIPYGAGNYAMDVFLPNLGASIDSAAAALTAASWATMVAGLTDSNAALSLPKFTISYDRTITDDLAALGMGVAFSDAANFANLSAQAVELEFVKHKTFISVDERGTRAGASTVTGVIATSLNVIQVNRPFIAVIRERSTGAILFMGKVARIP